MIELKLFSKLMRFFYHNYDKMRETNFFGGDQKHQQLKTRSQQLHSMFYMRSLKCALKSLSITLPIIISIGLRFWYIDCFMAFQRYSELKTLFHYDSNLMSSSTTVFSSRSEVLSQKLALRNFAELSEEQPRPSRVILTNVYGDPIAGFFQ